MRHLLIPLLIFFLLCGLVFGLISWWRTDTSWEGKVNQASIPLWQLAPDQLRALRPDFAEDVATFRTGWPDLSPSGKAKAVEAWQDWGSWLEAQDSSTLLPTQLLQWQALKQQAQLQLHTREVAQGFWGLSYPYLPDHLFLQMMVEAPILSQADAKDFMSRLRGLGDYLDNWEEGFREKWNQGIQAPAWALDSLIARLSYWVELPADQLPIYQDLAFKLATINPVAMNEYEAGDILEQAERLGETDIQPSLKKLISRLQTYRKVAKTDTLGLGFHPQAEEAYQLALLRQSSLSISPRTLLTWVDSALVDNQAMIDSHMSSGPVPASPSPLENYSAVQEKIQADLREMKQFLGGLLHHLPVKRLGTYAYPAYHASQLPHPLSYHPGSLDQAQPARLYLSENPTTLLSKPLLAQTTYHQGLPGLHYFFHHLQLNDSIPALLRQAWYPALGEGWAAYMDLQLDQILALYSGSRIAKLQYLQNQRLLLVLAKLDVTLHHERWSKDKGISYLNTCCAETVSPKVAAKLVEKIILHPGTYAAVYIGFHMWDQLYRQGRAQLDWKLSLPDFHTNCLSLGVIPISVLKDLGNSFFVENLAE